MPVVFWDSEGAGKDVQRARDFVAHGKATTAYAVFIDEGSAFAGRDRRADADADAITVT